MPKTVGAAKGDGGKRHPLNMRTTKDIREKLEDSASRTGRSLVQEVEVRLEHSLAKDDHLKESWGEDVFNIAESMAKSLWHIEREFGARWTEDPRVHRLFILATEEIIRAYRDLVTRDGRDVPVGSFEGKSDHELAQMFAALGGMSPPRPRPNRDRATTRAEARASVEVWNERMEKTGARPIARRRASKEKSK